MTNEDARQVKMFCIEQAVKTVGDSSIVLDTAKELYDWLKEDDIFVTGSLSVPLWHSDVDA